MNGIHHFRLLKAFVFACWVAGASCSIQHDPEPASLDLKPAGIGCSSINLVNDSHSIFGKNLDNCYTTEGLVLINKRGVQRTSPYVSTTGARATWRSRYASVNFAFVHMGFVWTGMNEKGLVISMMGIPEIESPPPDERPPLVDGQWIQYMLDTCQTVEEVLIASQDVRIITVDHYHIADRAGHSAVIEWLGGVKHVYSGEDLPLSVLTNSTYGSSIEDWLRYEESPFPPPNGSLERFRIAADRVRDFQSTDAGAAVDYAFETLSSIRSELIYGYPNTTQWSMVFDTQNLRAYFRTYSHPENRFIDLYDFDLSCDAPVQMLQIQEPLEGSVFPFFEDLDFAAACAHYRHFVESFQGYTPSESHVINEISFYMGFPCVGLEPPRRLRGRVTPG